MSTTLITSRDDKGRHAVGLFEVAYNKAGLDDDRAQRLNERGGELQDGITKLIAELTTCKWREQDGVIYFSVTSDGTTGPEWIERLESKGVKIESRVKSVLCSPDFKPTAGVTTEIAVLKGLLFADNARITRNIRAQAYAGTFTSGRKLFDPNAEVACLIREMFSDDEIEAMGLWWLVVMHEPIKDSDGDPNLLLVNRLDSGRWLYAYCGLLGDGWLRGSGFAFAVPQV
ncbi:MAG: hypothetical protein Q8L21_02630 [Candidatus Komeilibacteria bacterium]|nr:hypothetical protein [Candidatus Komeilibacteria bacterium]